MTVEGIGVMIAIATAVLLFASVAVAGPAVGADVPTIVARVLPAVVSITTRHVHEGQDRGTHVQRGLGSGVIVDARGYILTNHHVVDGADQIKVSLPDERVFTGRLIGADPTTDLAVIKIDGKRLPVAMLGDSARLRVGEPVVAIGNPLWIEGGPTVTAGVVSGLNRSMEQEGLPVLHHLIQTDAAINAGNSGGPLVNRAGQVVGVNTALIPSAHGISFAIPTSIARPVLRALIAGGKVIRPGLGLVAVSVTPQVAFANDLAVERGALIVDIEQQGPADEAGLRKGDVITAVRGERVRDLHDFHAAIWRRKAGETVELTIGRGGDETLGVRVRLRAEESSPRIRR